MIRKTLVLILLIFIGLPSLSRDKECNLVEDPVNARFQALLKRHKFLTPVYHKKCGYSNAFADGAKITVCDELFGIKGLTDDMILLVLLHEEGHNFYKHAQKRTALVNLMDSLKPTDKTYRLFRKSIVAYIQQNEFEADEYSYKIAVKEKLDNSACYALKFFTPPSNNIEDDEDSTHPATWRRVHRCLEVFNPSLYPNLEGQDNSAREEN